MSNYGGRHSGGRGRGRGGIGGRDGRGRGGSNQNNVGPKARLKPCGHFLKGNCNAGAGCTFAHVVKLHGRFDASTSMPESKDQNYNNSSFNSFGNNNYNSKNKLAAVSTVAIWETQGAIKIFTGSHDGYWRLWSTQGSQFQKEFEHNMGGGKVECLRIAANYLFCGFEAVSMSLPGDAKVGMIHVWNLTRPTDPPLELHMHTLMPYAHASCVTELLVVGDQIVSGCRSGVIRVWKFDATKPAFVLTHTIHGHAREITGLLVVDNLVWSSSIDGSIRLWDLTKNGECQYVITKDTKSNNNPVGHCGAVTGLLTCNMPGAGTFVLSSSLDGTIKAWNGSNGECVASEDHMAGVVSMALSKDISGNPILIIGLDSGNIMVRNLAQTPKAPAFALIFTLTPSFSTGHSGAVRCITEGPQNTFYTGGADGKLLVLQLTGDLSI
mmetsp:Transcript_8545/g.13164  ORF Transcript_8545/g.13164 Transcript_8545/m.13164 type:complete len:438 (+) Transcript_8545:151-1464(+)|eukprot:CAMPEP_0178938226 /NCGR_PEP_ID=MMETSP0786-20121207/26212_1 /TAXON_ID=186022 /ORGANISM="Thalassionema frauenfeldii, Strain CCMP 1798" /LENGTH=437 /DNA_ID=CAMNT_0020616919 /DNA_START=108 /DNA_END=1421 /DNA_ORIENTATION=+